MNTFGIIFKVSIFGESHGRAIGAVIDGVPSGIPITEDDFTEDILRRKSGQPGTTTRTEPDLPELISGIYNGFTTGAPVTVIFRNSDIRSSDYENLKNTPRPGHADFSARMKYGEFYDPRGGGHFSGRITLGLVAAGVIAKKIIQPVSVSSSILEIGGMSDIEKALHSIEGTGDSIGGIVECRATNIPAGLGEPFFYSAESVISQIVFSIPAIKGIEFGSGFASARMRGSVHNDLFISTEGVTSSNNASGINGGITNGNDIVFRVAVKPTSSISLPQQTINLKSGKIEPLQIKGRHDTCIALRIPVILEAALAVALADLKLIDKARKSV